MSAATETYVGLEDGTLPPPVDLDQMKKRILETHGTSIGDDDPLLMQHTMHSLFIEDLQAQLKAFAKGMTKILQGTGETTSNAVSECLRVLKDETLESSLQQTLSRMAEAAKLVEGVEGNLTRLRNTTFAMVALSWVAVLLNVLILIRS